MLSDRLMLQDTRILVAEDDEDLRATVAGALEAKGARVVTAESGVELVERMASDGPFGLVITDVAMPWGSGVRAMSLARTAGVQTPVLVMTGLNDEWITTEVLALGHNVALLRKPFGLHDLHAAVASLLLFQD
jgi:DNA-binding response OmpR family regulator